MVKNVQKLRARTGAGVMECRRALEEAGGDFDRALQIINDKGLARAGKKSGRETGAGLIESYLHNGRIGVLLEIRAETDFVVRSEPFRELAHEIAMQIASMEPADVKALLGQPYIKDESIKVQDLIKRIIAKVGENITVKKFCRYEI